MNKSKTRIVRGIWYIEMPKSLAREALWSGKDRGV